MFRCISKLVVASTISIFAISENAEAGAGFEVSTSNGTEFSMDLQFTPEACVSDPLPQKCTLSAEGQTDGNCPTKEKPAYTEANYGCEPDGEYEFQFRPSNDQGINCATSGSGILTLDESGDDPNFCALDSPVNAVCGSIRKMKLYTFVATASYTKGNPMPCNISIELQNSTDLQ